MGKHGKPAKARKLGAVFYSHSRRVWIARLPMGKTASGGARYLERCDTTRAGAIAKLQSARRKESP